MTEAAQYLPTFLDKLPNLYSIVGSARAKGIEPHAYLTHLYTELPRASTVEHLEALCRGTSHRAVAR